MHREKPQKKDRPERERSFDDLCYFIKTTSPAMATKAIMPKMISAVLIFKASATGGFACAIVTTPPFLVACVFSHSILPGKEKGKLMYVEIVNKLMQSAFAVAENRSAHRAVGCLFFQIAYVAEVIKVFADTDPRNPNLSRQFFSRKRFIDFL